MICRGDRVAQGSLLVVGPNCRAEQHPFRSILFATNLETTGLRAAQYASALSEHVHGRLTLLHVIEKQAKIPSPESGLIENRLKQELRSLLPSDVGLFCEPKVRLEYGSPAELIPVVAESESASLIVVGLRNQSALADHSPWSTLSHVIRECSGFAVICSELHPHHADSHDHSTIAANTKTRRQTCATEANNASDLRNTKEDLLKNSFMLSVRVEHSLPLLRSPNS